jgi:SpoVK/Ycf46/Vps4 family AAA+-type ATPase
MSPRTQSTQQDTAPEPLIATPAAAESLVAELAASMDGLIAIIEEETALVRAGALMKASELSAQKAAMASAYVKLRDKVSRNRIGLATFAPEAVDNARRRHEEFASLLKINLAVLATAREVAEDIVRNVSEAVGRSSAPSTYGRTAAQRPASTISARGIALDRSL